MDCLHPKLRIWFEIAELLFRAAEAARRAAARRNRRRFALASRGPYRSRHPGPDSAMWNALAAMLRRELRRYGAKAGMARHLGIPRQRITEFVSGRARRLPDAELTLRLLHWLAAKRAGRDLAV